MPYRTCLVLLVAACDPAGTTDSATGADSADTGDSAAEHLLGPCAGGGWGPIAIGELGAAIHVRAEGSDSGDGSEAAPFATLDAAMTAARAQDGAARIVIGPGHYTASISIGELLGDKDGLAIEGCGPDEVTLEAANEWDSILRVNGSQEVRLAGFTLAGGRRALTIYGGATAYLDSIAIVGSLRCGLLVDGATTSVSATSLGVYDTQRDSYEGDGYGYGVLVQGAQLSVNDAVIDGNATVGMLIHDASAVVGLDDVEVTNTVAADGFLGRGVQVQDLGQLTASSLRLSGNSDAAVYARQAVSIELTGVTVGEVALANAPDGGAAAGDGIVVTQGDTEHNYDVATFRATLTDFVVDGPTRAGVLLDRVTGTIAGTNSITPSAGDPGEGAVLVQGGAVISGATPYDLDAAGTPLDTFGLGLDTDTLDDVGVNPE